MQAFDIIVIGGGHAGCEAAHAAAKMGCRTALFSLSLQRIGWMSCNPAIGGLAKGQLVKEIDALGGIMGRITDQTAIQYRRLNASKGPAVRSSRAQCDKALYADQMQAFLKTLPGLTLFEGEATALLTDGKKIQGIQCTEGQKFFAPVVIVTVGTFLKARMFTGFDQTIGGRLGDQSATGLSENLQSLGFQLGRLKTGTPPRLHKNSIDYSCLKSQLGDPKPIPFSFYHVPKPFPLLPQVACHITYTNSRTHQIIADNFSRSPLFTGLIHGLGPRYCPSIEDKVKRFHTKDRHLIFLEPEGLASDEVYVNGISTSLPREVQAQFVRSIVGLEHAQFVQYGYAVEYDCIDSRQLRATLESKDIGGLFFAGQMNGTSGYEEAGAQGLLAGINGALTVLNKPPLILSRASSYMGVLADDLVLKGADEPYRMFTSRAEYRLLLREDNADLRLSLIGHQLGLLGDSEFAQFENRRNQIEHWRQAVADYLIFPTSDVNQWCMNHRMPPLQDRISGETFLKRPEITWAGLCELGFLGLDVAPDVQEQVEVQIKYAGYIQRDLDTLQMMQKSESIQIPIHLNFHQKSHTPLHKRQRFPSPQGFAGPPLPRLALLRWSLK